MEQRHTRIPRLVVFDIDGTLTATNVVDNECYAQAIGAVMDVNIAEQEWSGAPHMTDAGLTEWLWQQHFGRAPTTEEVERTRSLFVHLLGSALSSAPSRFAEVAGARRAMQHLQAEGWTVAIATGGWSASAHMKLAAAGIEVGSLPFASSDDHHTRAAIVSTAVQRAERAGSVKFRKVVSVGDASWDVACAAELGIPFVGVGHRVNASALRVAGARTVIENYRQLQALDDALRAAVVPHAESRLAATRRA